MNLQESLAIFVFSFEVCRVISFSTIVRKSQLLTHWPFAAVILVTINMSTQYAVSFSFFSEILITTCSMRYQPFLFAIKFDCCGIVLETFAEVPHTYTIET